MLLISPAERAPTLRNLGTSSPLPEQNGVDFMWPGAEGEWYGCQRKRVDDLVASIRGDRIARELGQSEQLFTAILLIEGHWDWDQLGISGRVASFTRAQFDGLMLSIQAAGWWVMHTTGIGDTAQTLQRIVAWSQKKTHGSLARRPKPRPDPEVKWGSNSHDATRLYVWQSVPGVGVGNARALVDAVGLPLKLTVTKAELLAVNGIGPGRVKKIMELFG